MTTTKCENCGLPGEATLYCPKCHDYIEMKRDESEKRIESEGKIVMHTPGPWEVYDDFYIRAIGAVGGSHAEVKSCASVPHEPVEVHKANARLMAAAPELLEACKNALDNLNEVPGRKRQWACKQLEAAIAKAEPAS